MEQKEEFKCSNKECGDCINGYCRVEKITCTSFFKKETKERIRWFPFSGEIK